MIQLINSEGRLHIPHSAITDKLMAEFYRTAASCPDPILICRYPDGDYDTVRWPMKAKHTKTLAKALYDSREMGLIPDDHAVLLPDATEFDIEANLK